MLNKFLSYTLLVSPVIITSFFVYDSAFPDWTNTLFLALLISFLVSIVNYLKIKNRKQVDVLPLLINVIGFLSATGFILFSDQGFYFSLFGKGITEWTFVSLLSLFLVASYFVSLKNTRNIGILISSVVVCYTLLNFLIIKYLPSIGTYTGYINLPMTSFGKLLNYAFVFTIIVFISSFAANFMQKRGYVFASITASKLVNIFYIFISAIIFINIALYTLRYVAADNYLKGAQSLSSGNILEAKKYINKAITVAPFDVYYLTRIEIVTRDIEKLLGSTSTNKQSLEKDYKTLVEYQISDAKKAIAYDNKSPANLMALGLAYERSMLLTKDDGYRLAIDSYEKARVYTTDKDYVDVVKAKLSFSAEKEKDALVSLDRALAYNPNSAPALYLYSQYYSSKNNLKAAIEYGQKAVQSAPNAADANMNLGLLYYKNNEIDKAIQMFGTTFSLSGQGDEVALYYLALSYKAKKDNNNLRLVLQELEKRVDPTSKELLSLRNSLIEASSKESSNTKTSPTVKK